MTIRVEFYGIARQRAGSESAEVPIPGPTSLEAVIRYLVAEFPNLATECLQGNQLQAGYVANVDGQRFVRDPKTQLKDNSCLLIISADAGG